VARDDCVPGIHVDRLARRFRQIRQVDAVTAFVDAP
jgi:hypothetical protein